MIASRTSTVDNAFNGSNCEHQGDKNELWDEHTQKGYAGNHNYKCKNAPIQGVCCCSCLSSASIGSKVA